eukprot:15206246-Alexandrium_andersonii.AAC.1
MRNMLNRLRRSNLELRGRKSGLKMGARSSRGERSAPLSAQISDVPRKASLTGVRSRKTTEAHTPIRNAPLPCY